MTATIRHLIPRQQRIDAERYRRAIQELGDAAFAAALRPSGLSRCASQAKPAAAIARVGCLFCGSNNLQPNGFCPDCGLGRRVCRGIRRAFQTGGAPHD